MSDEPDTKPDAPRSKSSIETFSLEAFMIRVGHEAKMLRARGDEATASLLESLASIAEKQISARTELIRELVSLLPICGKCAEPATQRLVAAIWCDEHAPCDAADIPRAASVRRAKKL